MSESTAQQDLVEKLRDLSEKLINEARVRGTPAPSHELLEEAAYQMFVAAEHIEKM